MIPPLHEHGSLSPGIHPATWDEIAARLGHESELRRVPRELLRGLVGVAPRDRPIRIWGEDDVCEAARWRTID